MHFYNHHFETSHHDIIFNFLEVNIRFRRSIQKGF